METQENLFTVRNASKMVVSTAVHMTVSHLTQNALRNYTPIQGDKTVFMAGNLAGWSASANTTPFTDKLVDKTADFIIAKRAERKAKKTEEAAKNEQ